VPSLHWFIYAFVRKEAVVSSQIEGTQATLVDLLTFEALGSQTKTEEQTSDIKEVCNYLEALEYARNEMARPKGLPLSIRLLHETHRRLLKGVRGAHKQPGKLRASQNWIGGTRPGNAVFVPPPPENVPELLGVLEKYLHADDGLHPLIRIALVHLQFETIHPYLDGNGRIGRLLITLLLEHWKQLKSPLLYLSLFLKRHRSEYYRLLDKVRQDGDWESWIEFFLEGVATISDEATIAARALYGIVNADRAQVLQSSDTTVTTVRLLEMLPEHPIVTIPAVVEMLATTKPTASKAVRVLQELDILVETTGRRRDRTYSYATYLKSLSAGTELSEP
jgi:Fic family protein